jgi:2-keto-4-pentenoate hydratase
MLSLAQRRSAADALAGAERTRVPIPPLSRTYPGLDVTESYEIQRVNVARRLAAGAEIRGHKVGLTSRAMQHQFGVCEPDFGHLLTDMFVADGATIAVAGLCQPRIEVEVAFVLGEDLGDGAVTVEGVLAATTCLLPALEIIDSRIADWQITLADTVADNASSARVVLGDAGVPPDGVNLSQIAAVLERNSEVAEKGASGDVLGNPAIAVCWLANKLAVLGVRLEAGSVVLSGSCTRAVPVGPGDSVRGDLHGLGLVSVNFS